MFSDSPPLLSDFMSAKHVGLHDYIDMNYQILSQAFLSATLGILRIRLVKEDNCDRYP